MKIVSGSTDRDVLPDYSPVAFGIGLIMFQALPIEMSFQTNVVSFYEKKLFQALPIEMSFQTKFSKWPQMLNVSGSTDRDVLPDPFHYNILFSKSN